MCRKNIPSCWWKCRLLTMEKLFFKEHLWENIEILYNWCWECCSNRLRKWKRCPFSILCNLKKLQNIKREIVVPFIWGYNSLTWISQLFVKSVLQMELWCPGLYGFLKEKNRGMVNKPNLMHKKKNQLTMQICIHFIWSFIYKKNIQPHLWKDNKYTQ